MKSALPQPARLAGVDLAAHRERAIRALVLFFGNDLSASPVQWEERARGVVAQLELYGLAPVHLSDPALSRNPDAEALLALIREHGRAMHARGGAA